MGSTIWSISKEEKEKLITTLTPELVVLRAKAGISQEELSDLIGVSRQTYSAIERGAKQMSWSTFLSLILFYDCNQKTHQVLRSIKAIPQEVMLAFNAGNKIFLSTTLKGMGLAVPNLFPTSSFVLK